MISSAIQALGFDQGFVLTGNPTNAKEFADSFKLVVGVDEINSAILSDDLSGLKITWNEIQAKIAELQAAEPLRLLREKRNRLLVESDWTGASDTAVTSAQQSAWRLYRQHLRDLPNTAVPTLDDNGQLAGVTWPARP